MTWDLNQQFTTEHKATESASKVSEIVVEYLYETVCLGYLHTNRNILFRDFAARV